MKRNISFGKRIGIALSAAGILFLVYAVVSSCIVSRQYGAYQKENTAYKTADPFMQLGNTLGEPELGDTVMQQWFAMMRDVSDTPYVAIGLYDSQGVLVGRSGPRLRFFDAGDNGESAVWVSLLELFSTEEYLSFCAQTGADGGFLYAGKIGCYVSARQYIPVRLTLTAREENGVLCPLETPYSFERELTQAPDGFTYQEWETGAGQEAGRISIDTAGLSSETIEIFEQVWSKNREEFARDIAPHNPSGDTTRDGVYGYGMGGTGNEESVTFRDGRLWRFQGDAYYLVKTVQLSPMQSARAQTQALRQKLLVLTGAAALLIVASVLLITLLQQRKIRRQQEKEARRAAYVPALEMIQDAAASRPVQSGVARIPDEAALAPEQERQSGHDFTEFSLTELVVKEVEKIRPAACERNVAVIFEPDRRHSVIADREELRLVFSDLLSYALQHVRRRGEVRVFLQASANARRIRCRVSYSGKPVAQEDLARVWDAVYHVGQKQAGISDGYEPGLPIAVGVLMLHHAPYGCRNTNDGVELWFSLPV